MIWLDWVVYIYLLLGIVIYLIKSILGNNWARIIKVVNIGLVLIVLEIKEKRLIICFLKKQEESLFKRKPMLTETTVPFALLN